MNRPEEPAGLPRNVQVDAETALTTLTGKPEYHEGWRVRSYDLRHTREDLDLVVDPPRWRERLASVATGIALAAGGADLNAWFGHPAGTFGERIGFIAGGVVAAVMAGLFYKVDSEDREAPRANMALVKKRLDDLISMFERGNGD